jgi:hypothetical protein
MRPTNRWHYRQERIARCGWSALATLTLTLAAYAQGRPDIVWIHAGHGSHVNSVAFSPNGTLLAIGSDDTTIKLWRVSDGAFVRTLAGHTSSVNSIARRKRGVSPLARVARAYLHRAHRLDPASPFRPTEPCSCRGVVTEPFVSGAYRTARSRARSRGTQIGSMLVDFGWGCRE